MAGKSRKKKEKELKVIWELDKNIPEEERQWRISQVYKILFEKTIISSGGHNMEPESAKDIFIKSMKVAAKMISQSYFNVTRYEDVSAYRERVYCYELYHQLRRIIPENIPYVVHAELDKCGHEVMVSLVGKRAPDLLFHEPGSMRNIAIVEVKSIENQSDYEKDLLVLSKFTQAVGYRLGIWLVFGEGKVNADIARKFQKPKLQVWHHRQVGQEPEVIIGEKIRL